MSADFVESRLFWFVLSFASAGVTLWVIGDEAARGISMLNTMLCSANFGAKCVRAEIRERASQPSGGSQ